VLHFCVACHEDERAAGESELEPRRKRIDLQKLHKARAGDIWAAGNAGGRGEIRGVCRADGGVDKRPGGVRLSKLEKKGKKKLVSELREKVKKSKTN